MKIWADSKVYILDTRPASLSLRSHCWFGNREGINSNPTVYIAGLFDEYLKEPPVRGSDVISNAQLQYNATVTLQNRKVSYSGIQIHFFAILKTALRSLYLFES